MRNVVRDLSILACSLLFSAVSYGQVANLTDSTDAAPAIMTPSAQTGLGADAFGIGAKVSLLGAGIEGAMRVTHRSNFRGGFNMFSYSRNFTKDDVSYAGQLNFKSLETHYDIFPFAGGFRVSPGVLIYAGTPITANASVPVSQIFSLGGTQYLSDLAAPVTGTGKITFNRAAPMATFGWGNLVSRKEGAHFSVPVELGIAYQGSPQASLNLTGNVCDTTGANCRSIASDSTVQANILSEETKINNSMRFFKVYPIISVGFGYKF